MAEDDALLDHIALYFLIKGGVRASIARKWMDGQWDTGEGELAVSNARDKAATALAAIASFKSGVADGC